jgi:uncharacterized membrane protein YkvA (DUF1232 family)
MDATHKRGFVRNLFRYLRDPEVGLLRKLVGGAALVYLVFPFDLIPDVLPIIGWLDDLGIVSAAMFFVAREVKRHASAHTDAPSAVHAEVRAGQEQAAVRPVQQLPPG